METSESSNLTKLPQEFTLWFTFFKKSKDKQLEEFEDNLKEISSFSTAEEFWGIYQHMKRPNSLPRGCEFFMFKKGIRPLWEDEANQGGGRFFISVKKNQANNKLWEDFLIATLMLGKDMDAVNGIVLNVRTYEVFISVWTKPLNEEQMTKIRNWMRTSMELLPELPIEYRKHPTNEDLAQKHEQGQRDEVEQTPILGESQEQELIENRAEGVSKNDEVKDQNISDENPIPESSQKPVTNPPESENDEKIDKPVVETGNQSHEDF